MGRMLLLWLALGAHATGAITVGSKAFSESNVLGEMLAILVEEKYSIPVERKAWLAGTKVAFDALRTGGIDVYPEYTGTGYGMILQMEGETDAQKVYEIVERDFKQRWDFVWSKPLGFANTYALAVRGDDDRFAGLGTISELKDKIGGMKYAAPHEFMERGDGHKRFIGVYGLEFAPENVISMDIGLIYAAIAEGRVDMAMVYSTDGRILARDLRLLEDDRRFFPPYHAAFVSRGESLERYPALAGAIGLLEGKVGESEMVAMNDAVDRLKQTPQAVARNFLIQKGLIEGTAAPATTTRKTGFFAYLSSQKNYLSKIIREHLILSFGALALACLVAVPTGIVLTRYPALGRFVFPLVNTVQTVPSLALLGFLIPFMGIGAPPALLALFLYSLLPLVRNTYTGIMGVDRSFIDASRGTGLTEMQILLNVEIPLALPVIIAGLRTAAVIVVGTATLAALIGAGGLGDPIFRGIASANTNLILLGALPAALLAIATDKLIGASENLLVSKGLRLQNKRV